uniref:Type II/III secretion system secretin-like domain-containing protein n=1 Tax=Fervidobacterium pennivorans TaxID=93466 RepID=A0A7V4CM50_FERPE
MNRGFILLSLLIFFATRILAIEISFFNTNLKDALNMLSVDTGAVIIYEPSISGAISIQVEAESLEKVLDLLLMPYSYYWTKVDGVYFVGNSNPNSSGFTNVARTYQIPLRYNSAETIMKSLPKAFQDYILNPVNQNSLLVYAPPPLVSKIASFISQIDLPSRGEEVYVKIIDVSERFLNSYLIDVGIQPSVAGTSYMLNFFQIPVLSTNLYFILNLSNSNIDVTDLEVLYEGRIKAFDSAQSKLSAQRNFTTTRYVDGKLTSVTTQANVELSIVPRFLYNNCVLDLSIRIEGFPSVNEMNTETRGTSLQTTLSVEYNKPYVVGIFSYERVVQKEGGVSFLKDLPIIGWLFKKFYNESEKRYIVFLLSIGSDLGKNNLVGDSK